MAVSSRDDCGLQQKHEYQVALRMNYHRSYIEYSAVLLFSLFFCCCCCCFDGKTIAHLEVFLLLDALPIVTWCSATPIASFELGLYL